MKMKYNMDMIILVLLVVILVALLYCYSNNNENFVLGINTCQLDKSGDCENAPNFSLSEFDKNNLGGISSNPDVKQSRKIKVIAMLNEDKKYKEAQYYKNDIDDENRDAITTQMLETKDYNGALGALHNLMGLK
jgi:hypothetical protein